jgi:hypothetical protein
MKKLLWLFVWLALLCVNAQAAPWLISDLNDPQMVTYDFDFDGVVESGVSPVLGWIKNDTVYLTDPGGTTTRCQVYKDLSPIAVGSHTVKYRIDFGRWGVSEWTVPFVFPKPTLTAPLPVRLGK